MLYSARAQRITRTLDMGRGDSIKGQVLRSHHYLALRAGKQPSPGNMCTHRATCEPCLPPLNSHLSADCLLQRERVAAPPDRSVVMLGALETYPDTIELPSNPRPAIAS